MPIKIKICHYSLPKQGSQLRNQIWERSQGSNEKAYTKIFQNILWEKFSI